MSNRLQRLREAKGFTLRDLADRVGTSNQQISHLELGKRQLTTDWLTRLAAVLDCHPWDIVAETLPAGLTEQERRLLDRFRQMTADEQASLLAKTAPSKSRARVQAKP